MKRRGVTRKRIPLLNLIVPLLAVVAADLLLILYAWPQIGKIAPYSLGLWVRMFLVDLPPAYLVVVLAIWVNKRIQRSGWGESVRKMGLSAFNARQTFAGALLALVSIGLTVLLLDLQGKVWQFGPKFLYFFLRVLFLTVVLEEVVYRGFVFRNLRQGRSFLAASLLAGLVFMLGHIPIAFGWVGCGSLSAVHIVLRLVMPFIGGILLAYLYDRGGFALLGCLLAHMGQVFGMTISSWLPQGQAGNWWCAHGSLVKSVTEIVLWSVVLGLLLRKRSRSR